MIQGHGDDAYRYGLEIRANFSSNVYGHVDLGPLKGHLAARLDAIGNYPEPEPYTLESAIACMEDIPTEAVCVTAGATEAIYLIAHAFQGSDSKIIGPTFSEYADACRLFAHSAALVFVPDGRKNAVRPENHPLLHSLMTSEPRGGWYPASEHFSASETDTRAAGRAMVWLCNPNNPDGRVIAKADLTAAIKKNPETVFVIDQSYGAFTQETLMTAREAAGHQNVIQLHSMTKRYAIPGLRLGYVVANPNIIKKIRQVRMPWSVNALAIEAGLYLCAHPDTAPIDLPALLSEAKRLRSRLEAIPGISVVPTDTHFMLCRLAEGRAKELKDWLAHEHGILIRDASNFEGLDEGCFRIAAQTTEQNDTLAEAIKAWQEAHR